jgi:hypothetical protein
MPILENQPNKAFERFESHMVGMVSEVLELPRGTVLTLKWRGDAGTLGFTRGGVVTSVPLETRIGPLHLHLAQDLVAIPEGLRYRLRTQRYAYKLFPSGDPRADAIIRWEFDADTPEGKECRNHLHLNVAHPGPLGRIDFNRLHVPTAWVLIEHVLRFLFHDLEVGARTTNWPAVLRASETDFYEKFSGKRYRWRSRTEP